MREQRCFGGELELLVGIDVLEEILQRAFEADLFHHLAHFAVDARDFVQPGLMNLCGRLPRRRAEICVERVPSLAVGQTTHAGGVAAGW